jgi:hypothetical protein
MAEINNICTSVVMIRLLSWTCDVRRQTQLTPMIRVPYSDDILAEVFK